jgi:Domain of unknown function (DUF6457)
MVRVDQWLSGARDALAQEAGLDPAQLDLTDREIGALLRIARVAAHDSGERINAPLLCYLVGFARARSGVELDRLAGAVPESSS